MANPLPEESTLMNPKQCEAMVAVTDPGDSEFFNHEQCTFIAKWETEEGSLYCDIHKEWDEYDG